MNPLRKTIFKLFALCVMLGALWIVSSDTTAEAAVDCFGSYDSCMTQCENNSLPYQEWINCRGNCLLNYGVCVNEAVFNKEGEIVGGFPDPTQAMPVIADFRMCLDNCPTCLLMDYVGDPEGFQGCLEAKIGCKVTCLDQF